MRKEPNISQNPNGGSDSGGCVPMVVTLIGLGMLIVGVLAIFNTAFGWELVLEVYGAAVEIPKYWDATIGVLAVGAIIAGIGWVMGRPAVIRFYRKNKLLTILGSVGLLVGVFFLLNEYDKSIRRANVEEFARMDSIREANPEAFAEGEDMVTPYADREIEFLVTNPTVDTMRVFLDGKEVFEIKPYEIGKGKTAHGQHQLEAKVKGKELPLLDLTPCWGCGRDGRQAIRERTAGVHNTRLWTLVLPKEWPDQSLNSSCSTIKRA